MPLVVYIKNRRLIRVRNDRWHEEDKKAVVKKRTMFVKAPGSAARKDSSPNVEIEGIEEEALLP